MNNQLGENGQVLQKRLREWGFGAPSGLDLPAEAPGLVPDAAYAEAHPDRYPFGWNPGGDILTMIGSGDLQATPLQMARAYAAIANGGRLCRPHLMDRIETSDGRVLRNPPDRCTKTLPYSAGELSYIRNALASVVTSGTAACAFNGFPLSQVSVMGKTGTAERGSSEFQDTSWFAAMVGPVDHPDYVVVTMVEQGGFGGNVAAPITRDVIERLEGISPVDSPHFGCAVANEVDG